MVVLDLSCFDAFPVLETPRLLLRKIETKDAASIFSMRKDARVGAFISRDLMQEEKQASALIERVEEGYKNKLVLAWAGFHRHSGQLIGTCGFNRFDVPNLRAEIGGEMAVDYWGKRLAPEAVHSILVYGFKYIGLYAVEALVSPTNRSAIYLLESMGFEKEGHFKKRVYYRNQFSDLAAYTCFSDQFCAGLSTSQAESGF